MILQLSRRFQKQIALLQDKYLQSLCRQLKNPTRIKLRMLELGDSTSSSLRTYRWEITEIGEAHTQGTHYELLTYDQTLGFLLGYREGVVNK